MIRRYIYKNIENKLFKGKIIIIAGARQVGKTTLLKQLTKDMTNTLWLNGDELQVQNLFGNASSDRLLSEFKGYKVVIIDEAQRISDIGLRLKLIADSFFQFINELFIRDSIKSLAVFIVITLFSRTADTEIGS